MQKEFSYKCKHFTEFNLSYVTRMYQNFKVLLILSDKIEDLCVFISVISFLPSVIIQRTKISAMAINDKITEHTGG